MQKMFKADWSNWPNDYPEQSDSLFEMQVNYDNVDTVRSKSLWPC